MAITMRAELNYSGCSCYDYVCLFNTASALFYKYTLLFIATCVVLLNVSNIYFSRSNVVDISIRLNSSQSKTHFTTAAAKTNGVTAGFFLTPFQSNTNHVSPADVVRNERQQTTTLASPFLIPQVSQSRSSADIFKETRLGEHDWCQENLRNLLAKPGSSELKQLEISYNISQNFTQRSMLNFDKVRSAISHNVTVTQHNNCISLYVVEQRLISFAFSRPYRGGSVFHTIIEGDNTISYCPYVDYGNDTYAIFCSVQERCANITSYLLYFDYLAYAAKIDHHPVYSVIFENRVCISVLKQPFPQPSLRWEKLIKSKHINNSLSQSDFNWHLKKHNKISLTQDQIQSCLKSSSNLSINFIGDSHARNLAYHAFRLIDQTTGAAKLHGNIRRVNIAYHWGDFMMGKFLTAVRRVLLQSRTENRPIAVVMDVGSWDVTFHNISYFATKAIPAFRDEMMFLHQQGLLNKTKMIFFDMPPMPMWYKKSINRRNLMSAAAGNRLLADSLSDVNVILVEYFSLSRVFVEVTAPNDVHYLVANNTGSYGHVGTALANYILELACEH